MTTGDFEPLSVAVPLREDPPGVFRVGKSRVLLELVIRAFQRGETPEGIVRSYSTLRLPDVYAVVSYYLANPGPIDEYLRSATRRQRRLGARLKHLSRRPRTCVSSF
jgi:uncharacterized protein (DUF433 family)